jgi:hypothetical protein
MPINQKFQYLSKSEERQHQIEKKTIKIKNDEYQYQTQMPLLQSKEISGELANVIGTARTVQDANKNSEELMK